MSGEREGDGPPIEAGLPDGVEVVPEDEEIPLTEPVPDPEGE